MKKVIFLSFAMILTQNLFCQYFSFGLNGGYGSYYLDDLKKFQTEMKEYLSFPVEETERFPAWFNYQSSIEYNFKKGKVLGLRAAYYTTGGRIHMADYSGEYRFDMIINGYSVGVLGKNELLKSEKTSVYASVATGVFSTSLSMKEFLKINGIDSTSSSNNFRALSYFVHPSVGIRYRLLKQVSLELNAGFEFVDDGKLHLGKKEYLVHQDGSYVRTNWSGLRASAGIYFNIVSFKTIKTDPDNFSGLK